MTNVKINFEKTEAKIKAKMEEQYNNGFAKGGILGTFLGVAGAVGIATIASISSSDYEDGIKAGHEEGQKAGYEEGQKAGYEEGIADTLECFKDYEHFANLTTVKHSAGMLEIDQASLQKIWDQQNYIVSHEICSDVGHPFDLNYDDHRPLVTFELREPH